MPDEIVTDYALFTPDVMIVKMKEGDYYVSEKWKGRDVYYKLLFERSRKSKHYASIEEAWVAATKKRERLLCRHPDCEIVEIDAALYQKNKGAIVELFRDEDGNVLFGIDGKKKKCWLYRQGEEQHMYVEKSLYRERIRSQIETLDREAETYYRNGMRDALIASENMALPRLYFEKYKAKELIKTFEWDRELFAIDTEYYNGSVDGFSRAIDLLKESLPTLTYRLIHVVDEEKVFLEEPLVIHDAIIGDCKVEWHGDAEELRCEHEPEEYFLIFIKDKASEAETFERCSFLPPDRRVIKVRQRGTTRLKLFLENLIVNTFFRMPSGPGADFVRDEWIPALAEFAGDDE